MQAFSDFEERIITITKHALRRFLERFHAPGTPHDGVRAMTNMVRRSTLVDERGDKYLYLFADWSFLLFFDKKAAVVVSCWREEYIGQHRNRPKYRHSRACEKRSWQKQIKSQI